MQALQGDDGREANKGKIIRDEDAVPLRDMGGNRHRWGKISYSAEREVPHIRPCRRRTNPGAADSTYALRDVPTVIEREEAIWDTINDKEVGSDSYSLPAELLNLDQPNMFAAPQYYRCGV